MIDYKTNVPWNLDMARKNATSCAGHLERVLEAQNEITELLAIAMDLETQIAKLIDQKPAEETMENA